jgi:Skp family chaperone for outer membrane proteins
MRGLIKTLVVACLAVGTCGGPGLAVGQDGEEKQVPLNVAILDVQSVFQNAAAVKSIQATMRTYIEAYRAGTQREEEEIRAAQQELARKRESLSGEQYEAERRKLEQRLLEAQARVQAIQDLVRDLKSCRVEHGLLLAQDQREVLLIGNLRHDAVQSHLHCVHALLLRFVKTALALLDARLRLQKPLFELATLGLVLFPG